jgi:ADP-ribose pyrophosphatase YjhB (NUDIX family)
MAKIIIASGPVIVENGKVLLDKHGDDNFWKFCGGRAENLEEDLIEVAKRKAKAELGIEIEILENTPFIMHIKQGEKDIILVHFLARRIGEIVPGPDIKKWDWIDVENLPENIGPNIEPTLVHFGLDRYEE